MTSRRDARRLSIRVSATGQVIVRAPRRASAHLVRQALEAHAGWIERQLRQAEENLRRHPLPRYRSGDHHRFLGRPLRLEVRGAASADDESSVQRRGRELWASLPEPDNPEQVRALLRQWYLSQARRYLARRLQTLVRSVPWVEHEPPLKLRFMRRQWGSCSSAGRISLNAWLIMAPSRCIDYVILHELCHLRELNHGPRFYRLLEELMPQWRQAKAELDAIRMP